VYQLDSLSNTVDLVADDEAPDDEEDNAFIGEEEQRADEVDVDKTGEADSDWVIGGELPAVDTSAIANAIDKNTKSSVQKSYNGLLLAALIGAITVAVAIVIAISIAHEKRRERRRRRGEDDDDVFDWADKY
jgi:hypothetical protein